MYRNDYEITSSDRVEPVLQIQQRLIQPVANETTFSKRRKKTKKPNVHTLLKATEFANEKLIAENKPFRYCIGKQGQELVFDVVMLDMKGKILSETIRKVTYEPIDRLIENISSNTGLFFDEKA